MECRYYRVGLVKKRRVRVIPVNESGVLKPGGRHSERFLSDFGERLAIWRRNDA